MTAGQSPPVAIPERQSSSPSLQHLPRGTERDISDESESAAASRADEPLLGSIVADRLPDRIYAGAEHGIRNDPPAPDRAEDVVAADNPVAVLDQELQEVENLPLDGPEYPVAAQLALPDVEHVIFKSIFQTGATVSERAAPAKFYS